MQGQPTNVSVKNNVLTSCGFCGDNIPATSFTRSATLKLMDNLVYERDLVRPQLSNNGLVDRSMS